MSRAIHAYAAMAPKESLRPFSYEPGELGPYDVEVEISHCGLCYSDIHLVDDDWKMSKYPLVPGHEVVGEVTKKGSRSLHPIAARVGIGWQRSACLECDLCLGGDENLCVKSSATCVGNHGGLAARFVTDGRFAFAIPDGLDSASAAPLLCGGVTVFAPMQRYGVGDGSRVGVIGIGGLGQMAIALLTAMGAEVTAFSSSSAKRDEAIRMGATHFVSSTDARDIRKHAGSMHLILSTVHVRLDWITYLQALRPNGVLCLLGMPPGLLTLPPAALLGQKSITTGDIGSRGAITDLLRFADRHEVRPEIEVSAMSDANDAIARLRANETRYRAVLENR
ncbi:MAG: NAD(P)-dependent alcohol dehydrogenase [Polyangiaceae bacterium]